MPDFFKKKSVIFCGSGLFFLIGILLYIFWEQLANVGFTIFGIEIFHSCYEALGRIGFPALFFACGAIIIVQGFNERKKDKNRQQSNP